MKISLAAWWRTNHIHGFPRFARMSSFFVYCWCVAVVRVLEYDEVVPVLQDSALNLSTDEQPSTKIPNFPAIGWGYWVISWIVDAGSLERGWLHWIANHSRVVETWKSNHHLCLGRKQVVGWALSKS